MKSKVINSLLTNVFIVRYCLLALTITSFLPLTFAQDSALVTKTYLINKDIPLYEFKLFDFDIDSISNQQEYEIRISMGTQFIQEIIASAMDEGTHIWLEDSLLDINFDGYNDFLLCEMSGEAGKNQFYDCWLFYPDSEKFIYNSDLSGLCNISTDESKKLLYVHMFDGCASQCYDRFIYRVINNKPILTEKEDQFYDLDTGKIRRIIEFYENGKLISKKEVEPVEIE